MRATSSGRLSVPWRNIRDHAKCDQAPPQDRPASRARSRRRAEAQEFRGEVVHFRHAVILLLGFVLALGWLMT